MIKQSMKVMLYSVISLAFFMTVSCKSNSNEKTEAEDHVIGITVSAQKFHELLKLKEDKIILDVRSAEEIKSTGLIPNAINIDFYDDAFKTELKKINLSKTIFVYCASGNRSAQALSILKEEGAQEVYNLLGGLPSWLHEGYTVVNI